MPEAKSLAPFATEAEPLFKLAVPSARVAEPSFSFAAPSEADAAAEATADAIRKIAEAVRSEGGSEAVNLKVAEQYVAAFSNLAKESNTLIMPANVADIGSLVSAGLKIIDSNKAAK